MLQRRDETIDIIRGIAIFTMVASNLTPYALAEGSPIWFRFYGTFAAPLFIGLAGMMICITDHFQKYHFWHYAKRGAAVMAVGVAIDAYIWGLVPFLTMDVLYLIGLAMPLCYLLGKLNTVIRYVVTFAIFAATPRLQEWADYRESADSYMLASGITLNEILAETTLAQSWFIDGWFPIFPWLGVAFAGYLVGGIRLRYPSFANGKALLVGLCTLAGGIYWWLADPVERFARQGYPDLFYPPTLSYFCVAAGVIILLFWLVDNYTLSRLLQPFKHYGKCSMLMYVLHSAVIGKHFLPQSRAGVMFAFGDFILLYLGFLTALLVVAWVVNKIKPKKPHPAVRFITGG